MTEIKVVCGDIAQFEADAIITNVNSCGVMSYNAADSAIYGSGQNTHYVQLQKNLPLYDNKVVITKSNSDNTGKYKNVVFVVDHNKKPLSTILYHALKEAESAGFEAVTIPTLRMQSSLGLVEKTPSDVAGEIAKAIEEFLDDDSQVLKSITFVVYKEKQKKDLLEKFLIKK